MQHPSSLLLLLCCLTTAACTTSAPRPGQFGFELARAESLYADLRDLRDRIEVTAPAGASIVEHNRRRTAVASRLGEVDSAALPPEDQRALGTMRRALRSDLDSLRSLAPAVTAEAGPPACDYEPKALALDSLRSRLYRCYAWAQSHVVVGTDTLDRLTVLGALGRTTDANRRRELFLSLNPVWVSVNGDNGPSSPYRRMIAEEMRRASSPPSLGQAGASGLPSDSLEPWLLALLRTWRAAAGDSLLEPWDWYYQGGAASRALSPRISRARLLQLNEEVYRSLGVGVKRLRIHYDVEPREGKTPVAYTTFGARPRYLNGGWRQGEPWVFATYRTGGLDNLNELLHETGHAVHIAAIRTRPAFADWPDSDPFTEAVADFVALEVYEPAWQQRWLGDSVPLAEGLRARYAGILLDVAWALFELRMQRHPDGDPNQVWTDLTRDYLGIRPHPELSWWAMRGQLIDAPGYMMNYAAGAILVAAIRARTAALHRPFTGGDPTWYQWIAPRLYQFGLSRPTRRVVEEFLGGPVTPEAILADMTRLKFTTEAQRTQRTRLQAESSYSRFGDRE